MLDIFLTFQNLSTVCFLHVQQQNHGYESSFEGGLFLKFPEFSTKAIIVRDDKYLDFVPLTMSDCGNSVPTSSSMSNLLSSTPVCRKLCDFQDTLTSDSEYLDSLLFKLKEYYKTSNIILIAPNYIGRDNTPVTIPRLAVG